MFLRQQKLNMPRNLNSLTPATMLAVLAAKEAIFKAMGNPQLSWHDVTIINDASGKPVCHYHDIRF